MRTWDLDLEHAELGFVSGNQRADAHQAWVVGGLLTGLITPAYTPESAYAAAERFAGRKPRDHQPWYQGRPDQIIFWAFMSILMTGIAGYSIDVADWFGVIFCCLLGATSLLTLITAVRVRNDPAWRARGVIARLQTHPTEAAELAAVLERDHTTNPEAVVNVAALRYQQQRWRDAVALYRRYLADAPDDRLAALRCADALLHASDPAAARDVADSLGEGVDAAVRRQQAALLENGHCNAVPTTDADPPGYRDFSRYLAALSVRNTAAMTELSETYPAHSAFQKLADPPSAAAILDCALATSGTERRESAGVAPGPRPAGDSPGSHDSQQ